jgi:RNA polymerase sigma-70 factor (ECF subfamily)
MEFAESTIRPPPPPSADAFELEAVPFLPNVARYARLLTRDSADADDLTQETFLRAFKAWDSFRPGSDCRKWLFTICRNLYLRDRQRAERFVATDDTDGELRATREMYFRVRDQGCKDLFERVDLAPALDEARRSLQPEYREVVVLIDIEDCSYAAAADARNVPIGTVRSRLFRARRLLQQALMKHAEDLGFLTPLAERPTAGGTRQ